MTNKYYFIIVWVFVTAFYVYSNPSGATTSEIAATNEERYAEAIQDCSATISNLSWVLYKPAVMRQAYDYCLNLYKGEKTEQEFHLGVFHEFINSALWYDSAVWLHQNGLFVPAASELCETLNLSAGRALYIPRTPYPPAAQREGIEGQVNVEAIFDEHGFFKEFVVLRGEPEYIFDLAARRFIMKHILCPSSEEIEFRTVVKFEIKIN